MKGDSSWNVLYLLIIAAIALVIIFSLIKPIFQQAASFSGAGMVFIRNIR